VEQPSRPRSSTGDPTASFTIGTYSPVFFFALLGAATLSFSEVAVASALAGIVQSTFRPKRRPTLSQVCFNAANLALSSCAGLLVIQRRIPGLTEQPLLITDCSFAGNLSSSRSGLSIPVSICGACLLQGGLFCGDDLWSRNAVDDSRKSAEGRTHR
jgi:hypothetical protein